MGGEGSKPLSLTISPLLPAFHLQSTRSRKTTVFFSPGPTCAATRARCTQQHAHGRRACVNPLYKCAGLQLAIVTFRDAGALRRKRFADVNRSALERKVAHLT